MGIKNTFQEKQKINKGAKQKNQCFFNNFITQKQNQNVKRVQYQYILQIFLTINELINNYVGYHFAFQAQADKFQIQNATQAECMLQLNIKICLLIFVLFSILYQEDKKGIKHFDKTF
ncbi:hypothetical protein ABPG72_002002 [Tetrahymena utriculariae]